MQYRLIIAGGRDFNDAVLLASVMEPVITNVTTQGLQLIIISGTARGADTLGARYARDNGIAVEEYPADWDRHGKSAGYKRNEQMADVADGVLVFWDGFSKGTKHMIDIAKRRQLELHIVKYKETK